MLWELLSTRNFSAPFWNHLYEIILGYVPKYALHQLIEDERYQNLVEKMVVSDIDIFCSKFDILQKHFSDFLDKINAFILETEDPVGIRIHKHFIVKIASEHQKELSWEDLIGKLQHALADSLPKELLELDAIISEYAKTELKEGKGPSKLEVHMSPLTVKLLKHLNLLSYMRTVFISSLSKHMPLKTSLSLADSFLESAKLAAQFCANFKLRDDLQRAGFHTLVSNLFLQKKEALLAYLALSFEIYLQNSSSKEGQETINKMWRYDLISPRVMQQALKEHVGVHEPKEAKDTELGSTTVVLEAILPMLKKLPETAVVCLRG